MPLQTITSKSGILAAALSALVLTTTAGAQTRSDTPQFSRENLSVIKIRPGQKLRFNSGKVVGITPVGPSRPNDFAVQKDPGGLTITFGECNSAAVSTCTNGVGSLDHDEDSGSCSFTCLSAP